MMACVAKALFGALEDGDGEGGGFSGAGARLAEDIDAARARGISRDWISEGVT
jgi:hypothetical protein